MADQLKVFYLLLHLGVDDYDKTGVRAFETERDRDAALSLVQSLPGSGQWRKAEIHVFAGKVVRVVSGVSWSFNGDAENKELEDVFRAATEWLAVSGAS